MLMEKSVTRSSLNVVRSLGLHSAELFGFGPVKHISIFNFKHNNNPASILHLLLPSSPWPPIVPFSPVETHSAGHHTSWSSIVYTKGTCWSHKCSVIACVSVFLYKENKGPHSHPIMTGSQKYVD